MNNIEKLIANYRYKHPLAEKLGGEFIMQCDKAQIDAIQLVCDIFENAPLKQEPCEEDLPSVQPSRLKAKWLDNNNRGTALNPFWDRYICSNCGHCSDLENYCANCGAEMED